MLISFLIIVNVIFFGYLRINKTPCGLTFSQAQSDSCYYAQAKSLSKVTMCEKIKNILLADDCYFELASSLKQDLLCLKIKNSTKLAECHFSLDSLLAPEIIISSVELRTAEAGDPNFVLTPYVEGVKYYNRNPSADGAIQIVLKAANKDIQDLTFSADCQIDLENNGDIATICSYLNACDNDGFDDQRNSKAVLSSDMQKVILLPRGETVEFNFYVSSIPIAYKIQEIYQRDLKEPYIHAIICDIRFISETQRIEKSVQIKDYFVKTHIY